MKDKPELTFRTGFRVRLRLLTADDAVTLTTWMNDPETTQYITQYLPKTLEAEHAWIELLYKNDKDIVFGIEHIEDDTLIGVIGLHHIQYRHGTASTGATIGSKDHLGKGYGSEAKMLLLKYAFDTLNLRKIGARVYAFNGRSLRYQEKCGYRVEGVLKEQHFINGEYHDEVLLAVRREDWLPIWERYQSTGTV
ncbi:MAG: hypothetical protein RL150_271 [Candidatus Parcubacteria bacterium]|jgi:RimJ/RimL family protein N-acetyltransferase